VCWKDTNRCSTQEANPTGKIVYRDKQQVQNFSYFPVLICLSGFLSFLIVLGFITLPDEWIMKLKVVTSFFTSVSFQQWFHETTDMFQKVVVLAVVISIVAAVCLFVLPSIMKDSTVLQTKPISTHEKPNIILIIVDALTAEDMSLYGYSLPTTPNLEKITKTWTVYTDAISPIVCTEGYLPSILIGRYLYQDGYINYRIGEMVYRSSSWVDISLLLKKEGYDIWQRGFLTPGYVHLGYGINHFGDDNANNFMHRYWLQPEGKVIKYPYFPYMPLYLTKIFPTSLKKNYVSLLGLPIIFESHSFKKPWFLYYHYSGVHGPMYYSPDTLGTFLPDKDVLVKRSEIEKYYGRYNIKYQDMVDKLRLRYDEAILQQDRYLADMIRVLKNEGLYDSSMIIITADHGQNFANGYSSHCTPLLSYPENHVPLLIKYPYQTTGRTINTVVSAIDLTPTFLDIAGIAYETRWFDGKSLLEASNDANDRIVFAKYRSPSTVAAINSRWKLTYRGSKTYLFDYHNDPQEKVNLIEQYGNDAEVIALENSLNQYVSKIKLINRGGIP
jgi:arylsulfatase A-like enzyme